MAVPFVKSVGEATLELGKTITDLPATLLFGKDGDRLVKDDPKKLSSVLAGAGWGAPDSTTNRMARSVVQRESGGNPKAHNPSGATGLFQMMTPLHCGHYGIPKSDCVIWLEDAGNNARAAKKLHATSGWTPWATSGPIPPVPVTDWDPTVDPGKNTLVGKAEEAGDAIADPLGSAGGAITDFLGTLLSADTWFRIGKTWMGGVFVIVGVGSLVYIVANQATGGAVKSATKTVVKTAVTKGVVK